ncbi:hypothetical protein [Bosea sp. RAC05]|uniref:hypothetical protein n=1 Tax=Bosea sp. RAC05 TaxID=1842539 RepID=UPI00083E4D40|nr:hypothetical protein [Bosea sp. RAC05]AOG03236.1 hypothetical protein BSY19_4945 [Bosea sp. RAC05]
MKICIPLTYEATVRTARGDTDKRTYREVVEFDLPEADGAPVACRWAGSGIQTGAGDHDKDIRIVDGKPFEPYFSPGRYDREREEFVHDPMRSDLPDLADQLAHVVRERYATRSLIAALEVKRAGPPRPQTVIRSDRDSVIETLGEFVRDNLRSIDGVLHGLGHLPMLQVRTGSSFHGPTTVGVELVSAGTIEGSNWLNAYPITEFEAASAAAKALAENLEQRGYKAVYKPPTSFPVEIVDANLVTHDVSDVLRSALIRHVEHALAYHLVKGSKESADCYESVRQMRWPNRKDDSEASPEDDLAILQHAAAVYASEGGEDAWFVSAAVERFNRAIGDLALSELDL